MAFIASCIASLFSSCTSSCPCLSNFIAKHCDCCGCCSQSDSGSAEVVEPLVAPSPDVAQGMVAAGVSASPTLANSMASSNEEMRPMKRRSVSFADGIDLTVPHYTPGSPTKSIIKRQSSTGFSRNPPPDELL